jgi:hypothetical protein
MATIICNKCLTRTEMARVWYRRIFPKKNGLFHRRPYIGTSKKNPANRSVASAFYRRSYYITVLITTVCCQTSRWNVSSVCRKNLSPNGVCRGDVYQRLPSRIMNLAEWGGGGCLTNERRSSIGLWLFWRGRCKQRLAFKICPSSRCWSDEK